VSSPASILKATHAFTLNGHPVTVDTVAVEAIDTLTVVATVRWNGGCSVVPVVLRSEADRHDVALVIEVRPDNHDLRTGAVLARIPYGANRRTWLDGYRRAAYEVANRAAWTAID
jgi:hypothetical protein